MNVVITIFQLLPAIIQAVKAIEEALPQQGQGAAKLEAVKNMLMAIDGAYQNIWPQLSGVIGVLVGLFNQAGIFKKA